MSKNAMTIANLIDFVKAMSSKEAVLLCDPTASVRSEAVGDWYCMIEGYIQAESGRSSDDCWRRAKLACLESLERGWEPKAWEHLKDVNVFALSDRMGITKGKKTLQRIDKATGARNPKMDKFVAAVHKNPPHVAGSPTVKLSKADSIDKANKRILANEKARKAYADKKVKKPSFASVKHDHFVKHGTYKAVVEDNLLGPFGVMYDQLMDLPKEKLVGMLCATLIVQKVVG